MINDQDPRTSDILDGPDQRDRFNHYRDMREVIILNGPIGVGKTTLGRAFAERLGDVFIDNDDLRNRSKRWIDEVLTVIDRLVAIGVEILARSPVLVIAKPLRAREWTMLQAKFRTQGAKIFCVTLTASADAILDPARGREFSAGERDRIAEMIAQRYAARPFSDLTIRTNQASFKDTLERLVGGSRKLLSVSANQS